MLDSFLAALKLKDEVRSGWVLRGVRAPESVADHSWGTAYLCLLFAEAGGVDQSRSVEMAIVHDLAEAITGDVATRVERMSDPRVNADKRRRENDAMEALFGQAADSDQPSVPDAHARVVALWHEYEESNTPLALFVRDMNLIDMCAQAFAYEAGGRYDAKTENQNFPDFEGMDEFFATTRPRLSTEIGRRLYQALSARYAALGSVACRGGPRLSSPDASRTDPADD